MHKLASVCVGVAVAAFFLGYWFGIDTDASINHLASRIEAIEAKNSRPSAQPEAVLSKQDKPTHGWLVRAFEPPEMSHHAGKLRTAQEAGSFVYSGNWMGLNQHLNHDGIFLPNQAAFNVRGNFAPEESGEFLFAVHVRLADDGGKEHHRLTNCYADMSMGTETGILAGKLKVDSKSRKAALLATKSVRATTGQPQLIDLVFTCNLPSTVPSHLLQFRICHREKSEQRFRPVLAVLPKPAADLQPLRAQP